MRIRQKRPFNSRGQAEISQFAFLFVVAFLGSLLIFPRVSPQRKEELKDRALLKKFALTPVYWDEQGVGPMYGTIKVEFVVNGTVTQNEELSETTTTYNANASWILQFDQSGVTEKKTLSGTGNVVTVDKGPDPPTRSSSKTTYSLDPSEAVSMRTYSSAGAGELGVTASKKQKCCWFGIASLWDFKVKSHLEGKDIDGQTYNMDFDQTWHITIPSHWQGLAECIAAHRNCPSGIIEGTFSDGKTFGSYRAPVFFYEVAGMGNANWEPMLRALGEPVDGSGLPYVQGTVTVSWNLGGKPQDVEAVIETPEDYENWQPAAEKTEDKAGPLPIIVNVRLHKKGEKDKPASQKAQFRFKLVDTTKEKGVCLNWPADKAQDTYDLRIEQDENKDLDIKDGKVGQKAETKKKNVSEATVTISCFDWGAYARLKVTAVLDDGKGTKIPAHLESDKSKYELPIPKDKNDNKIADSWEKKNGVYGKKAEADDESLPEGDGDCGDGLTRYEEYRGFMENGEHIFGDPKKKDLFICNKLGQMAELGISVFENISGLAVHSKLKPGGENGPGELDASRIINLNHTNMAHIVDQHGVFIDKGDEGFTSEAERVKGSEGVIGTPKRCEKVKIGIGLLGEKYSAYRRASIVAHELLHCCNVWHHGEMDLKERKFQSCVGAKYICVFNARGEPIGGFSNNLVWEPTGVEYEPSDPALAAGFLVWIGSKQGQHSGDTDCVMRYTCAGGYLNEAGDYVIFPDDEVFGLSLCTDGQGTGVNEPGRKPEPRYGDANGGKGKCEKQMCVNDNLH